MAEVGSGGQERGQSQSCCISIVVITAHIFDHLLCASTLYSELSQSLCKPHYGDENVEFQEAEPLNHSPVQGFEAQQGPPDPTV